jgi:tellurite resistance-related uncharacterized protein
MTYTRHLPADLEHIRTTPVFDQLTVPDGLLTAHRVANDTWGLLVVHSGVLEFMFEDDRDNIISVGGGESIAIPPGRPHHVALPHPATFTVEFHRV